MHANLPRGHGAAGGAAGVCSIRGCTTAAVTHSWNCRTCCCYSVSGIGLLAISAAQRAVRVGDPSGIRRDLVV